MDLLLDAICVVDTEGRFVHVSAAGERIFGYAPQEMIGRPMIEFVHPDDRAHVACGRRDPGGRTQAHFREPLRPQGRTRGSHHVVGVLVTVRSGASRGGARHYRSQARRVDSGSVVRDLGGGSRGRGLASTVRAHSSDHRATAAGQELLCRTA
ncbi:MAG: PAS domain S-box protein [Comamonadaceae bacterium]|nr:PAS domain S-box protein [Comamonadaceae bacterium]